MKFLAISCLILLYALSSANAIRKYSAAIAAGLSPNQTITVHGHFLAEADVVNFRFQDTDDIDNTQTVPLDFTLELSKQTVFRNTYTDGAWGKQETSGPFLFDKNESFTVTIYTTEHSFGISVNGEFIWTYTYRLPLSTAKFFVAKGDLELETITLFETHESVTENTNEKPFEKPNYPVLPVKQPSVPFFGTLWKEWEASEAYVIRGTVKSVTSENINIDFLGNPTPDNNIALRLSIRFTENKVYRQSLVADKWRTEETNGGFPFALGQSFELVVVADHDHFKILVNGKLVWTYNYTFELSRIAYLHVDGPVTLTTITPSVHFNTPINCGGTGNETTTPVPLKPLNPVTAAVIPTRVCDATFRDVLPVFSPSVPFLAYIPYVEGEEVGQRVTVNGQFNTNIPDGTHQWVEIRLQPCPTGATTNDNVAVTVSFRFDKKEIFTFDYVDKKWTPNPNKNTAFPVTKGEKFTVTFVADVNAYKIFLNNKHFIDHPYHNSKPRSRFVRIYGPVSLTSVTYERNNRLELNVN